MITPQRRKDKRMQISCEVLKDRMVGIKVAPTSRIRTISRPLGSIRNPPLEMSRNNEVVEAKRVSWHFAARKYTIFPLDSARIGSFTFIVRQSLSNRMRQLSLLFRNLKFFYLMEQEHSTTEDWKRCFGEIRNIGSKNVSLGKLENEFEDKSNYEKISEHWIRTFFN